MKFTFKSYKGDKKSSEDTSPTNSPSPQQKRKDQIRRAQKTHRERKEAYTKSLELEVVQLRANEARILQETKTLYAEIRNLKRLLGENGIQVPRVEAMAHSDIAILGEKEEESLEIGIREVGTKHRQQRIYIQRHGSTQHRHRPNQQSVASRTNEGNHLGAPPKFSHPFSSPKSSSSIVRQSPSVDSMITKRVGELDLTVMGMDFVLSLESPCFPHMFPSSSFASTGHALCVSATLLHHHPSTSPNSSDQATWQIPALSIERLLQLSNSIPLLDGEITPVHAWDMVRNHPEFGDLELERLERLKASLIKVVRCYGFGGVIDQVAFDDAVFETFVVGRVF